MVDYLPSDNFSFIRCQREDGKTQNTQELNDQTQGGRRLLILFAWLFAKQRHLDKYRALYMAQGFDVLTVIVNVRDFLLPATGSHRIAAQIIGFLRQHQHEYGHYIFQAFSVGAYQVGELFVMLQKERNKELLAETKSRLKGKHGRDGEIISNQIRCTRLDLRFGPGSGPSSGRLVSSDHRQRAAAVGHLHAHGRPSALVVPHLDPLLYQIIRSSQEQHHGRARAGVHVQRRCGGQLRDANQAH